ncbi:flagellar biosynthesis anti-sigma factor FlgM [Eubacteriaceae bacterium ES2]|nr:flagellar biosynthesis anti-sigma factor FlgM [Eubacteriaceae bacterium ES2]
MKIGYLNNNVSIQQNQTKDSLDVKNKSKDGLSAKGKTDSNEISSERSVDFEDNRLAIAKSAILFDVSVKESDRVAELKAAINNGTYHVSSEDLAEALLK